MWQVVLKQQPLTTETLRAHDEGFPALHRSQSSVASSRSRYSDTFDTSKERANDALCRYHGKPSETSVALYLDGSSLRTTERSMTDGWQARQLHVPNCSSLDHEAMSSQHARFPIHLYKMTSSEFLNNLVVSGSPQGNQLNFSLVYLDYTSARHRQKDIQRLSDSGALCQGVLAVTCPALVQSEVKNKLRILGVDVRIDCPFAGVLKLHFETAPWQSELKEYFAYVGHGRRTMMWFALFVACGWDPDYLDNKTSWISRVEMELFCVVAYSCS